MEGREDGRYTKCPTGIDNDTWDRLYPAKIEIERITEEPRVPHQYPIRALYTWTFLNIWHMAKQMEMHGIKYEIKMYNNKEYIKTGLRSKEAIVYWKVEWREKTRSQEVHVGYNGNLTEQDYRVLTDITGIKIEDGKYVGPGERK